MDRAQADGKATRRRADGGNRCSSGRRKGNVHALRWTKGDGARTTVTLRLPATSAEPLLVERASSPWQREGLDAADRSVARPRLHSAQRPLAYVAFADQASLAIL